MAWQLQMEDEIRNQLFYKLMKSDAINNNNNESGCETNEIFL